MRPSRLAAFALLAACALAGRPAPGHASPTYPAIYVFGDSLSDAGNDWIGSLHLEPKSPPYYRAISATA
jgi:phospholipase/lecithinase/hemolysin